MNANTQTAVDQGRQAPESITRLERAFLAELELIESTRELVRQSGPWGASYRSKAGLEVSGNAEMLLLEIVIDETVAAAQTELSRPGTPVKVDISDWRRTTFDSPIEAMRRQMHYEERQAKERELCMAFRPVALWNHILTQYPQQRLEDESRSRAAETLIEGLDLFRQKEVKQVGGRVEIEIRMWSESDYGNKQVRRYSHGATRQFAGLSEAMEVMAMASSRETQWPGLMAMARKLEETTQHGFTFSSRDRHEFDGGLSFVCFQNAIKVYLPQAVASTLNVFVSLHGEHVRERYRNRY